MVMRTAAHSKAVPSLPARGFPCWTVASMPLSRVDLEMLRNRTPQSNSIHMATVPWQQDAMQLKKDLQQRFAAAAAGKAIVGT